MISVQNLLRQLSGNKILGCLLLFALVVSSCGGTQKTVDRTKSRTKSSSTSKGKTTTKANTKNDKVKVIEWNEATDDRKPPITEAKDNSNASEDMSKNELIKEDEYDITYFVPFDAGAYASSANPSDRFVQYYSGMLIATEILERESINLNINVVDEKKRKFETILHGSVNRETDVIVGPYDRQALRVAANYAQENEIPLVSPWQASSKIAKENPYYIQLRPNLDEHYYSIFEDIKKNFKDENLIIVGSKTSPKDGGRIRKLQRMAKDVFGKSDENHFQEFLAIPDSIDLGVTAFDSLFIENKTNVVLVPNWSFKDEEFIYGSLRRMSVEKGMANMVVYGMPIMLESDKINFDYYNSLNMRVARSKFVDERDGDVQRFKRDFVEKYGALPSDDAYEGYDNLMYIGRNLYKYGKNFQYHLDNDQGYYLQAGYRVEPTYQDSPDDKKKDINYFENKNVEIIEFKNNRFVRNLD